MTRAAILQSPVPLMMAAICFLSLGYLAWLRRERFLQWWVSAWALLLARFTLNLVVPTPFDAAWQGTLAALLRLGFGTAVLAGALTLRGRTARWWWVPLVAVGGVLLNELLKHAMPAPYSNATILLGMMACVLAGAWHVVRAAELPRFERAVTATAIAIYGVVSGISPWIGDDLGLFAPVSLLGWAAQLTVGMGMLATSFRLVYDRDLAAARARDRDLTTALGGFVSVCMHCKSVRAPDQSWQRLEVFARQQTGTMLSHGICPDCTTAHYADHVA